MIFGESFEEGPEKELPPGWRLHADWLKLPTWEGMWCSEDDAIGMTGFRWYKLLWEGVRFEDGVIECELMQPAFDPGRPIGLVFRAGGHEFRDAYAVVLDAQAHRLELRIGERGVASATVPAGLGQWLPVRVEVRGGRIQVFARRERCALASPSGRGAGGEGGSQSKAARGPLAGANSSHPNPLPRGEGDHFRPLPEGVGTTRPLPERDLTSRPVIDFLDPKPLPGRPGRFRCQRVARLVSQVEDRDRRQDVHAAADARSPGRLSRPGEPMVGPDRDRQRRCRVRLGRRPALQHAPLAEDRDPLRHRHGRRGQSRPAPLRAVGRQRANLLKAGSICRGSGDATVALQNADGSRTYASQRLAGIEADWKRFDFHAHSPTPRTTKPASPYGSTGPARSGWTRSC